jgi:long-chain acyl-CoA synthetase
MIASPQAASSFASMARQSVSEGPGTIAELFLEQCEIYEDRPALSFLYGEDVRVLTYGKLRKVVMELAVGLQWRGLKAGGHVLVCARNTPEFIFAYFAIQLSGGVDMCINPDANTASVLDLVRDTRPAMALVEDPDLGSRIEKDCGIPVVYMNWKKGGYRNLKSLQKVFSFMGSGIRSRDHRDSASVFFNKEDTALSRGLVFTHHSLLSNLDAYSSSLNATEADRLLLRFALWHSSGRLGLLTSIIKGMELLLPADNVLTDAQRLEPTLMMADTDSLIDLYRRLMDGDHTVGGFANILLRVYIFIGRESMRSLGRITGQRAVFHRTDRLSGLALVTDFVLLLFLLPVKLAGDSVFGLRLRHALGGHLRAVITGGAPMPELLDRFYDMIGVAVLSCYFKTEASFVIAARILQYVGQRSRLMPGTVGPPLPGAEIKILQAGQDVSHTAGAVGEILVRGEFLFQRYLRGGEVFADESGWFYTGDRGALSAEGELRLV